MSKVRKLLALTMVGGLIALGAAACVESDPSAAETPADAETVPNTAAQTDADGNTVPAPGAEELPAEGAEGEGESGEGDVAAGETVFASNCSACHAGSGTEAGGVGPKLAEAGLDDSAVRTIVTNGQGAMPAGLASGEDLDNVAAYVLSLQ